MANYRDDDNPNASAGTTENKPSRPRLSARWDVIDNKLICRWVLAD